MGKWVLALALGLLSCGPAKSYSRIGQARTVLNAAETLDAAKLAPYEYTAAREYLNKAREHVGYSSYKTAEDYAAKALAMAEKARERALDQRSK